MIAAAAQPLGTMFHDVSDPEHLNSYIKVARNGWVANGDDLTRIEHAEAFDDAFIDRLDEHGLTAGGEAALLVRIHVISDLSWDQISRTIGVGKRTVQYWGTGLAREISPRSSERIVEVYRAIASVPADTPAERRASLLASNGGHSILHQLILTAPEGQQLYFSSVSVRDRITN